MSPDLFNFTEKSQKSDDRPSLSGPLAHRMRPKNLDEYMGQARALGENRPLRLWIQSDRVPSLILWGPPGCGKTTLAEVIAESTSSRFTSLSAVLSGVKDIKAAIASAEQARDLHGRSTILFVDEIHRFNKSQQDALLPHVENGTVTLVGATTENPSFRINHALLSRVRVIHLERHDADSLVQLIERALKDPNRGLGGMLNLEPEVVRWLAETSEGDARRALTSLENIYSILASTFPEPVSLEQAQEALEKQPLPYDHDGEEHYNVVSAFIKSLRDSDPDASLYYLARMLEGGEDPLFICRRMVVFASEDIGNADPRALLMAIAARDSVEFVGMPEARINLGHVVTYLAVAPKSNASYVGIDGAIAEVRETGALPIPMNLRNAPTQLMKQEGYGKGYRYVHDDPGARDQPHLPEGVKKRTFYRPKKSGLEIKIGDFLNQNKPR